MLQTSIQLSFSDFSEKLKKFWKISGEKILDIEQNYDESLGSPVFTINGKYTSRGWTEWTQGFVYGSAILQFDATSDTQFLEIGRNKTIEKMAPHISHMGVHDHGFNNVSTYGNLLRLMKEGKIASNDWERNFYELAIKVSGAIQASRWTNLGHKKGYIYSFNGPHSLFVDTIRSCRALMLSHQLGHVLQAENDVKVSLLQRALAHIESTALYSVFYGEGRDAYDVSGRTAHESVFNVVDGRFRCPNSQQGYTGFSTWTRGLAWAICGFAEELEFIETIDEAAWEALGGKQKWVDLMAKAAKATCDFYIENTPTDGICYWDTGAPNLHRIDRYLDKPADPFNDFEPVDSSASAIAAQGFLRLAKYLEKSDESLSNRYLQAGLTISNSLLSEVYLSHDPKHQGLLLHTIYHQPNGWDHVPAGSKIAQGESCQWGDYHFRELMLYIQKMIINEPYYTFFNICQK